MIIHLSTSLFSLERFYRTAKRHLHTAKPSQLVGRNSEEQEIEEFISVRINEKRSGSLYVSGAPGTGKTAVVTHVLDKLKVNVSQLMQKL